ncbi:MAG: hypothetical protein KAX05_12885 [Bacteroidales bacterium]|nr:hypothetical protein [Bacteroidales bacterium]
MENPFKKIGPRDKIPESLKREVMFSVQFANLMLDIADLFFLKQPSAINELFRLNINDNKHK